MSHEPRSSSGLSPLTYQVFRAVWIATVASNIGSYMEAVGEYWLMSSLAHSSFYVALTQAADSLSIVLLALPAGALADIVDRRGLLVASQGWMFVVAAVLAAMTVMGTVSPFSLLALIFLLGLGEAISRPAFSPFLLGSIPAREMRSAITLNGVAVNVGRGIGPALGGIVIAATGPAAVFMLNALSFAGIVIVLLRVNRRKKAETTQLPAERMFEAIRTGMRYVRNSPPLHGLLVRVTAFAVSISALPALLPTLARYELGLGSFGYGILFGLFGLGAILGGIVLVPRAIRRVSPDRLVVLSTIAFALSLVVMGTVENAGVVGIVMVLAGISQLAAFSSFSYILFRNLPNWVMSRVASMYQMVLQAAIVGGSVLWGLAADGLGIKAALLLAGIALSLELAAKVKFPLRVTAAIAGDEDVSSTSAEPWPFPSMLVEPELEQGPVLVQIEYKVDAKNLPGFMKAMEDLSSIRKRNGSLYWGLFRHDAREDVYVEAFLVESWVQHLRQHERMTAADRLAIDHAFSFHAGSEPPIVSHFVAEPLSRWRESKP